MKSICIPTNSVFQAINPLTDKRFPMGWQTFRLRRRDWNGGAEVAETTVKRLPRCGFRRTGKAMGQVYQCCWWIWREINVSFQVRISHALRFISHLRPIYWLPRSSEHGTLVPVFELCHLLRDLLPVFIQRLFCSLVTGRERRPMDLFGFLCVYFIIIHFRY
jgi:hypothetical protein